MTLQQIYAAIAADLRLQYELGYRPPDSRPNKYHKIDLKAARTKTSPSRPATATSPPNKNHFPAKNSWHISFPEPVTLKSG
jgi:hypothetical protein